MENHHDICRIRRLMNSFEISKYDLYSLLSQHMSNFKYNKK